jgi:protein SCO1/2
MQGSTTKPAGVAARRRPVCAAGVGLRRTAVWMLATLLGAGVLSAAAQVAPIGEKSMGEPSNQLPQVLKKATIAQHLGASLPLTALFRDETGQSVALGSYFGSKPVVLALVYYRCPLLCSEELNGMVGALEMLPQVPGKDFDVIVASIDPSEGPELAAQEKALYVKRYGRPETAGGWHFLTGDAASVQALANAVGYGYVRVPGPDGRMTEFAHASAIAIITPQGRIAQYYLGVEYPPKQMSEALRKAAGGGIGSPVELILTYCYRYDPHTGRRSLMIARIVQLGGVLTVLALGSYMLVMFRRDAIAAAQRAIAQQKNGNAAMMNAVKKANG